VKDLLTTLYFFPDTGPFPLQLRLSPPNYFRTATGLCLAPLVPLRPFLIGVIAFRFTFTWSATNILPIGDLFFKTGSFRSATAAEYFKWL
jgi:hypothetical protein